MDYTLLLIILLSGFYIPSCCVLREYHYVNLRMTWNDARSYCREKYTDLATVENMEDVKSLIALNTDKVNPGTSSIWIGLHDDPTSWKGTIGRDVNSWRWSTAGAPIMTEYHNWRHGEPDYFVSTALCVAIYPSGFWNDLRCQVEKCFVCYGVQQSFTLVKTKLSWKDAQQHCRRHYTDLAVIRNAEENDQVAYLVDQNDLNEHCWIGLHRVAWTWSDQTNLSFTYWDDGEPDSSRGKEHCACVQSPEFKWSDTDCDKKRPFFCHRAVQEVKVMRMKIQTDADLTDPHINAQFLQQLRDSLAKQEITNFRLRWKNSTHKTEL